MKKLVLLSACLISLVINNCNQEGSSTLANDSETPILKFNHDEKSLINSKKFRLQGSCTNDKALTVSSIPQMTSLTVSSCVFDEFTIAAEAPSNGKYQIQISQPDLGQNAEINLQVLELDKLSKIDFNGQNSELTIKGDFLYIYTLIWSSGRADENLQIVNISDPNNPQDVMNFKFPGHVKVIGTDRYVYAFRREHSRKYWIEVYDLLLPKEKILVNQVECCNNGMGDAWMDFDYSVKINNTIYASEDFPGAEQLALDVSDPLNPKILPGEKENFALRPGYFVGEYYYTHETFAEINQKELYIYQTNATNKWVLVKTLSFDGSAGAKIGEAQGKIFVRANSNLYTLDVSSPGAPVIMKKEKLDDENASYRISDNIYFYSEQYYDGFGLRFDFVRPGLPVPKTQPYVGTEYYNYMFYKGHVLAKSKNHIDIFRCPASFNCGQK